MFRLARTVFIVLILFVGFLFALPESAHACSTQNLVRNPKNLNCGPLECQGQPQAGFWTSLVEYAYLDGTTCTQTEYFSDSQCINEHQGQLPAACLTGCSSDAQCVSGSYCTGTNPQVNQCDGDRTIGSWCQSWTCGVECLTTQGCQPVPPGQDRTGPYSTATQCEQAKINNQCPQDVNVCTLSASVSGQTATFTSTYSASGQNQSSYQINLHPDINNFNSILTGWRSNGTVNHTYSPGEYTARLEAKKNDGAGLTTCDYPSGGGKICIAPTSPTGLSPNGTSFPASTVAVSLNWQPVQGATHYDIRVDDGDNSIDRADGPQPNNCGSGVAHDICINNYSGTQMTINLKNNPEGRALRWWVHSGNCGQSPQTEASFTVNPLGCSLNVSDSPLGGGAYCVGTEARIDWTWSGGSGSYSTLRLFNDNLGTFQDFNSGIDNTAPYTFTSANLPYNNNFRLQVVDSAGCIGTSGTVRSSTQAQCTPSSGCNNNGVCETGETATSCPNDCPGGSGGGGTGTTCTGSNVVCRIGVSQGCSTTGFTDEQHQYCWAHLNDRNALCQYCWSDIAPEIKPIAVTIPKENATPGSNIFLNCPVTPPKPRFTADQPPAAEIAQGTTTTTPTTMEIN